MLSTTSEFPFQVGVRSAEFHDTVESLFSNLQKNINWFQNYLEQSRVKLQCSTEGRETTFDC